jgi:Domain of unknown function (DUF1792).
MDGSRGKIYIWGTGNYSRLVYESVNKEKYVVSGFIDSNIEKQGEIWGDNITIFSPEHLLNTKFEYILISVKKCAGILSICEKMNINREKIVIFWDEKNYSECIKYTDGISYLIEKLYKSQLKIENMPYELESRQKICIKSGESLLKKIIEHKCSLCRFGDGEFEIIRKKERAWFQNVDDDLALRLLEVLNSDNPNILIGIADNFGSLEAYTEEAADAIRNYLHGDTRDEVLKLINQDRIYYDAYVSRPYYMYKDKGYAKKIFDIFKQIWENRSLLIVEGQFSRVGVGNDLFENAREIRRILCPEKNAFSKYEEIVSTVYKRIRYNELVLVSLGPTATVLTYDLACRGIQAIDIGQLDNEYEWFLRKSERRIKLPNKGVAELPESYYSETMIENAGFEEQIIEKILI